MNFVEVEVMLNSMLWRTESVIDAKDSVGSGDSRLKIALYHLIIGVV
jgi:hypothetical protein